LNGAFGATVSLVYTRWRRQVSEGFSCEEKAVLRKEAVDSETFLALSPSGTLNLAAKLAGTAISGQFVFGVTPTLRVEKSLDMPRKSATSLVT
jgi:hypothetical protein